MLQGAQLTSQYRWGALQATGYYLTWFSQDVFAKYIIYVDSIIELHLIGYISHIY